MKKNYNSHMPKVIKAFTGSSFVGREVLPRLPHLVPIEFSLEFNQIGETFIAISSPKYPGILSEARSMKEAYKNAHDAILTYFEVPRECAKAIKFNIIDEATRGKGGSNVLLRKIEIKQTAHA